MKTDYDRLFYERRLLNTGDNYPVAGVDEAGRGPLAGPVVVAAVILPRFWLSSGMPPAFAELNDSKQLTASRREQFYNALTLHPGIFKSVVTIDVETIDKLNILRANDLGMQRALDGLIDLGIDLKHVLVDGLRVPCIRQPQTPIVKGDCKSYSIAAASILAKVTRDHLMKEYAVRWPQYGFERNMGYGTAEHRKAIETFGPCPIHRRSFLHLDEQNQQPSLF